MTWNEIGGRLGGWEGGIGKGREGIQGRGHLVAGKKPNCQTAMKRERGESKRCEGGHLYYFWQNKEHYWLMTK